MLTTSEPGGSKLGLPYEIGPPLEQSGSLSLAWSNIYDFRGSSSASDACLFMIDKFCWLIEWWLLSLRSVFC